METYDQQRNSRSPWLAALAALVGLVLLTWWILGRSRSIDTTVGANGVTRVADAPALTTAVETYIQFVSARDAHDAMAIDHDFTATGIRNLAAALEGVAGAGGPDVQRELRAVREQASALQENASSLRHADSARELFITLSGIMAAIQTARFPSAEQPAADVKRAAEAIDRNTPLLEQPNAVQTFFERAAGALRAMPSSSAA